MGDRHESEAVKSRGSLGEFRNEGILALENVDVTDGDFNGWGTHDWIGLDLSFSSWGDYLVIELDGAVGTKDKVFIHLVVGSTGDDEGHLLSLWRSESVIQSNSRGNVVTSDVGAAAVAVLDACSSISEFAESGWGLFVGVIFGFDSDFAIDDFLFDGDFDSGGIHASFGDSDVGGAKSDAVDLTGFVDGGNAFLIGSVADTSGIGWFGEGDLGFFTDVGGDASGLSFKLDFDSFLGS